MALLEGKVVVATGGGSGIGRAVVEGCIRAGAKVGVLERSPEKVADLTKNLGPSVLAIQGDATSIDDAERVVAETTSAFGRLDVLTCFVGVHDGFANVLDLPRDRIVDAFDELFRPNVASCIVATRAAVDELRKTEGSVIFTASHAAFHAGGGGVLYTASKFAVRGLVTQLAHELAPKIRVNAVGPGGAITDLRGLESLGQGALFNDASLEAARANVQRIVPMPYEPVGETHVGPYLFLAAKELSGTLTGAVLPSDGGVAVRGFVSMNGGAQPTQAPAAAGEEG